MVGIVIAKGGVHDRKVVWDGSAGSCTASGSRWVSPRFVSWGGQEPRNGVGYLRWVGAYIPMGQCTGQGDAASLSTLSEDRGEVLDATPTADLVASSEMPAMPCLLGWRMGLGWANRYGGDNGLREAPTEAALDVRLVSVGEVRIERWCIASHLLFGCENRNGLVWRTLQDWGNTVMEPVVGDATREGSTHGFGVQQVYPEQTPVLAIGGALDVRVETSELGEGATIEATYYGIEDGYGIDPDKLFTASGEVFDPRGYTAASNTYSLGTLLRVCHGDRCVTVRVNDTCGACGLDLSRAAFAALAPLSVGRISVRVEVQE